MHSAYGQPSAVLTCSRKLVRPEQTTINQKTHNPKRDKEQVTLAPLIVFTLTPFITSFIKFDAGFDAELYEWTTQWVEENWPFAELAYPGRSIQWTPWDQL